MGRFNRKGQDQETARREDFRGRRRMPRLEALESRRLLSGNTTGGVQMVPAAVAVGPLTVSSITPGGASTYPVTPNSIVVTFNKPVVLSSIGANALTVTGPTGVTVNLGKPSGVDDPSFPTQVSFPFVFTRTPGADANGKYTEVVNTGSITAKDGATVQTFSSTFTLADSTPPVVTNTTLNGRIIKIFFNKQVDASTINNTTVALIRAGDPNGGFNMNPRNVIVTADSRVAISYDSATQSATINLSSLPQTLLPTDHYAIVVQTPPISSNGYISGPGVLDQLGNPLNGQFNGTFPSGSAATNPPTPSSYRSFVQDLGVKTLAAPVFNSVALATGSDSGIPNDNNTNVQQPTFTGLISSSFPGVSAGLTVLVEFNGLSHTNSNTGQAVPPGTFDLNVGPGGRGFTGNYDAIAVTDANGRFTVKAPSNLPDGLNRVRFLVIAQPEAPPLPGFSSILDLSFRVDTSHPTIDTSGTHASGSSLPSGAKISSFTSLSLYVTDPVAPSSLSSPLAVPTQLSFPALDPSTANNLSNYSLYLLNQGVSGTTMVDESAFIKSATFVSTTQRTQTNQPYTGTVNFTFSTGLPAGNYVFVAHTQEAGFSGLRDAAGNAFLGNTAPNGNGGSQYQLYFQLQSQAAFITSVSAVSPDGTLSGPRSFFEVPQPGTTARAEAPPNKFVIQFSNPLNATADYTNTVQIIASADTVGGTPDGNFGTLGITDDGTGYSRVNPVGTTVTIASSNPNAVAGQPGFDNELVLNLPQGFTLNPDYYRLYLPNSTSTSSTSTSANTAIFDLFGNQLDGEFLGNQTASGSYQDLLPTGEQRPGLSGDGTAGGAFLTGYEVVPNGNIIYAKPGAADDPFNPGNAPDGSLAKPFPTLAPQAGYTAANGGDLNSSVNFGTGFNPAFDRMGAGQFHRSALYAAQVASARGPVVVIALPGPSTTDPNTGVTTQQTFVIQAPSGVDSLLNDGSVAIPAMTTLAFEPGAVVKLQNASILVQNQGSAFQALGGANPGQQVIFTSYANDAVAGDTNHDGANTVPRGGDWGGILFRNFDQTNRSSTFPGQLQTTANASQNNRLKGPGGADAISGGDDVMSIFNFASLSYAGGAVPQTIGFRYDAITLQNSRPTITNTSIAQSGTGNGAAGSQAAISANVDSLREDASARGPLVRNVTFANNSLNGIYIRPEVNGVAEPTNAISYPINPTTKGGQRNFTLSSPYPYLLNTPMIIGGLFLQETGGSTSTEPDRLYVQPGMMLKLSKNAGIEVLSFGSGNRQASINVGDRTYIKEFDANPGFGPLLANGQPDPNFKANSTGDARVLFTSLYDNTASTSYFDPITGLTTQLVAPLDSANTGAINPFQPTVGNVPDQARWGGIQIDSPSIAVIDEATIQFGGGSVNTSGGTVGRHALEFAQAGGFGAFGTGTHISITNNNLIGNSDVPMNITGDGLFAADPTRPLQSGNPFFRGNIMQGNDLNGLGVVATSPGDRERTIVNVNSVWNLTDLTYIVRGTITLGGAFLPPQGSTTQLSPIPAPAVTLTIQSLLPGTVLANGQTVAKPGESPIIKLLGTAPPLSTETSATIGSEAYQGAGFVVGMDNGVDPPADPLIDTGVNSSLRFVGIGPNQTTGQSRVPVIITSIHDQTVGTTVRGVTMNQVIPNDTTAPAAGDGGNITFGALAATSYNLLDPRLGNIIDNADIRYISSIQQIGGGIIRTYDINGDNGFNPVIFTPGYDDYYNQRLGTPVTVPNPVTGNTTNFGDQFNQPNAMTVSNSNFSTFSQIGFYAHQGFNAIFVNQNYNGAFVYRSSVQGEPTNTYFVNNTFSNMPVAVQIDSTQVNDSGSPAPAQAILLNNTFFNNAIGFNVNSAVYNGLNDLSHVQFLAMNNIFDGSTTAGINMIGQVRGSQGQNNLYFNNGTNVAQTSVLGFLGDFHSFTGDPAFVNPAIGNFNLTASSAAIDSSRSEIGPYSLGNMLTPAATQILGSQGAVRALGGRSNPFGGEGSSQTPQDYIFLPGSPLPTFVSEWVPVLASASGGYSSPFSNAATFNYAPISGERDQAGNLRVDDTNKPNLGSGATPYFDIGALEYIQVFPPHVTSVTATYTDPTSVTGSTTKSIYSIGGVAGTNVAPNTIQFQLDHNLDPNTINNKTVILQASGGDGIFGNGNSTSDRFIDLSGKLSFDPTTNILTINLGASGLVLTNDEYRLELLGTGSQVIRDPQGNALDGENTAGGSATGAQLALPSGDGVPGGNTFVTFTIDTHPPAIVPGTFGLAPVSDSNRLDSITNVTTPTFQGNITDIFPPLNPVAGQTVSIDISTKGNGVFDILNAGVGTTDATGHFSVKITNTLPNSPYNVGADGILAYDYTKTPPVQSVDDYGYSVARVRIVDQSGNASNTITAPLSSYNSTGAATSFVVDTNGPLVTSVSPGPNTVATVTPNGVAVTVTFSKNVDPASFTASSIKVVRAGGDGIFGNANDVPLAIDPNSLAFSYIGGPQGAESVTFNIIGSQSKPLTNDQYQVSILGTGSAPVTDIAGNPLGNGSDFKSTLVVYSPSLQHTLFVGPASDIIDPTATAGDRTNPYTTITTALAAAGTGDTVAVLPGVYNESINLKSLVILRSASLSSTNLSIVPGDPLQTIIRGVAPTTTTTGGVTTTTGSLATVTGVNLTSVAGGSTLNTEISGFTIAYPLAGNPASGPITNGSVGLDLYNSDIVVDHNYIIDTSIGIRETGLGANAVMARVFNNGIIGNTLGVAVDGTGATSFAVDAYLDNNTIALNDTGVAIYANPTNPLFTIIANNIFWQNRDLTTSHNGKAIIATDPNKALVLSNLFSSNGPSVSSPADDTFNIEGGFNPAILTTTHTDGLGNYTGNPSFVSPRDPRPTVDGPATFFLDASFDLTKNSAAIDRANPTYAPSIDFLYRGRVIGVPGHSFPAGNPYDQSIGAADAGAFEYNGTNGIPSGGQAFHIVSTSLAQGGASLAGGQIVPSVAAPSSITVDFSANVNKATVTPNDLVLSGSGVSLSNPVHATSLSWVDDHTVTFNLTGGYNKTGTVLVNIPANAVRDVQGRGNFALGDGIVLSPPAAQVAAVPTAAITPSIVQITLVTTPTTPAKKAAAKRRKA
jgi:hypothetical protein